MVLITIVLGLVMGHDVEITPAASAAYTQAMHMILAIFTFLCLLATFVSVKSIDSPHSLTNRTQETKP